MTRIHNTSAWSALLLAGLLCTTTAGAQSHDMAQHANTAASTPATATAAALPWVNAEIRRVDKSSGKVTLKHAEIPNLDMPGMTMVFAVQDPAQLATVQAGDAVQFTAAQVNGQYVVQSLRPRSGADPTR